MNQYSGYTKLMIGGELRPLHLGTNQTAIWCQEKGKEENRAVELHEYLMWFDTERLKKNKVSGLDVRHMLYSALYAGARYDKQKVDFTAEEVGFWMDTIEPEVMADFWSFFFGHQLQELARKTRNLESLNQEN